MTARRADEPAERPRPRPRPSLPPTEPPLAAAPPDEPAPPRIIEQKPRAKQKRRRLPGRQLSRVEAAQPAQVAAAAGNAVVGAAKIGRILSRSSWRIARQLPGVNVVEAQAQKLRDTAAHEVARLLELKPATPITPEERRVMTLVQDADLDPEPLRTAMSELLERSSRSDGRGGRDYLFGTIVSQLIPDEARILAALSSGNSFATVDVVAKQIGRSATRPVLGNISTIAAAAGLSRPKDVGTYLDRLVGFGLIAFGPPDSELDSQFDALTTDRVILDAKADIEQSKAGSARIVRKAMHLSPLGREFWAACAPTRPRLGPAD